MTYDPKKHHRRSIRLKGYDYSSRGLYFVTVCTYKRHCMFGDINDGIMQLNSFGQIARQNWLHSESIRDNVKLDAFVIMPNHVHGIIGIVGSDHHVGAYRDTPLPRSDNPSSQDHHTPQCDGNTDPKTELKSPSKTLGAIIRGYKSSVTAKINTIGKTAGQKVWQRNYYEHIIRDEQSLERIRHYIINNPVQWDEDRNNPKIYN